MSDVITHGSLFSGIGGFDYAGELCGMKTVWVCEIESAPVAILNRHFPDAIQLGDITRIDGAKIQPVDVMTFGSPCQGMSVAGTRCGLDSNKSESVLFYEAVRIIYEMREATNGKYPKVIIWENVPGAFSSNGGLDFRAVLETLTKSKIPMPKSGRWSTAGMVRGREIDIAWRTPDAQYWGVPQRRKRIKLVGDFTGRCAAKILFECDSMSWYFKESRKQRQGTPTHTKNGIETTNREIICFEPGAASRVGSHIDINKCSTLRAEMGDNHPAEVLSIENHANDSRVGIREDGTIQTLTQRMGTGGGNVPMILQELEVHAYNSHPMDSKITEINDGIMPTVTCKLAKGSADSPLIAYSFDSLASNSMKSSNPHSGCREVTVAKTIDTTRPDPAKNQGGIAIVEPIYCIQGNMIGREDKNGPQGSGVNEDVSFTLNTTDKHGVAYSIDRAAFNQGKNAQYGISIQDDGTVQTMVAKGPHAVCNPPQYIVRRLTPLECERLQGFPDGWTEWGVFDGKYKKTSDSARYKALGNAVDIPTTLAIMATIHEYLTRKKGQENEQR